MNTLHSFRRESCLLVPYPPADKISLLVRENEWHDEIIVCVNSMAPFS